MSKVEVQTANLPEQIRVSSGSAIVLGLTGGKLESAPTTAYLMTYTNSKCTANCGFCPQASSSCSRADMLSRVTWPIFPTDKALDGLERAVKRCAIQRVCIQALNYLDVFQHLQAIVHAVSQLVKAPISVSCQPLNRENLELLAHSGVARIAIPLDAATEEVFLKVKGKNAGGPYIWREQLKLLEEAVAVFGKDKVSTHLIVGLGETEREMVAILQKCVDMTVLPALFAFTPIGGTALEDRSKPPIEQYRRIQIARYLIVNRLARYEDMRFDECDHVSDFGVGRNVLLENAVTGEPFFTSGCSACNRPYYNETPRGPIYNFPRSLTEIELGEALKQLRLEENSKP